MNVYVIDNGGQFSDHVITFLRSDRCLSDIDSIKHIICGRDAAVVAIVTEANWIAIKPVPLISLISDSDFREFRDGEPVVSMAVRQWPLWFIEETIDAMSAEREKSLASVRSGLVKFVTQESTTAYYDSLIAQLKHIVGVRETH